MFLSLSFAFNALATCLKEKNRVTTTMILYMEDTLDEEDVSMIFDELEVELSFVNLVLVKTTSPQNFFVDERPTTSFSPALLKTDNYACGL